MTDITNATRAAWAQAAIQLFTDLTRCDREDALGDLLCNLMHWSRQNNFDFQAALSRATDHFEEERDEEIMLDAVMAAPEMLEALEQAVAALNTPARFPVPTLHSCSYRVAALCQSAIAKAKGGAQ